MERRGPSPQGQSRMEGGRGAGQRGRAAARGGGASPAAIVVPAHEHLAPPTADGAVGLIAVIIVLVRALQEAVLGSTAEAQRPPGSSQASQGEGRLRTQPLGFGLETSTQSPGDTTPLPIQPGSSPDHRSGKGTPCLPTAVDKPRRGAWEGPEKKACTALWSPAPRARRPTHQPVHAHFTLATVSPHLGT